MFEKKELTIVWPPQFMPIPRKKESTTTTKRNFLIIVVISRLKAVYFLCIFDPENAVKGQGVGDKLGSKGDVN